MLPLRLRGTASRVIAFERGKDGWVSVDDQLAVFMPLRGTMDNARRTVHLRGRTLRFELPDAPATADPAAGRFVLDRPNHPITVIWE